MLAFEIHPLATSPSLLAALSEMLIETVAHGGSVGFMHPLARADASLGADRSRVALVTVNTDPGRLRLEPPPAAVARGSNRTGGV